MSAAEAVDALTRPWTDVVTVDGRMTAVEHEPLLDMLREAIHSDLGGTTAGAGDKARRNLIDMTAFTLWENIDGQCRAWWRELSKSAPSAELKDLVRELHGVLLAGRASEQIDDLLYVRVTQQMVEWRGQIWKMFDRDSVKELLEPCPTCGERWIYQPDGGRSSALIAYWSESQAAEAKCQRCGQVWAGSFQLVNLGRMIGANADVDSLRELGVDVA